MSVCVRARSSERGASAVEFALVVPMLIILVFGMIDFGWAINRYTMVNNASREAVRVASLGGTVSEITAAANASLDGTSGTPTITVTCLKANGATCGAAYDTQTESGGTAIITVKTTHSWLTPLGDSFSGNLILTKTNRMRIE